jgi:glycosyltransferase involved in cell wall biosynthesis
LTPRPRKLLFVVTEDWYFWSHRLPLALAAKRAGFEVSVAARMAEHKEPIRRLGLKPIPLRLRRSSRNPFRELAAILELTLIYRRESPDLVHHVAAKPVIYGSIAAWLAGVPVVVNALAGLGYAFIARGPLAWVRRKLMGLVFRTALAAPGRVVFQNADDAGLFVREGIVRDEKIAIIRGSGVDPALFAPAPEPPGSPVIVLPARLLWDKGVGEFVEAARRLRAEGLRARFALVGAVDEENPAAVPRERLEEWARDGSVEVWGRRDDMPAVYASSPPFTPRPTSSACPRTARACPRPCSRARRAAARWPPPTFRAAARSRATRRRACCSRRATRADSGTPCGGSSRTPRSARAWAERPAAPPRPSSRSRG